VRVGIPKETATGERRVALVPETIGRLGEGIEAIIEPGAGEAASFSDDAYREAGATIGDPWGADVVAKVAPPSAEEVARLLSGQVLIAFLQPLTDAAGIERLTSAGVQAFALESIPRITRAQPMDALSSQATVSGYKAALIAADRLPRFLPMLMTAAGTIPPAKVLVMGAGVAGLQAIATTRRLGAVVSAFDVRPAVREQVESLGATFLDLGVTGEETEGGYARELTPEQQTAQQAELQARIPQFDALITTAAIPGRPAPTLVTAEAAHGMRAGSVIVDLAAESGGNCELTVAGEEIVDGGVLIVGALNLPATMPTHASQLLSRNIASIVGLMVRDGELALDWDDEILVGACVTRGKDAA
jgi:NAD(P) transhydrogenase subunit alpha